MLPVSGPSNMLHGLLSARCAGGWRPLISHLHRRVFPKMLTMTGIGAKRFVSSEIQEKDEQAGESTTATDTGIIHKTEQETLVYFDNVYPRTASLWSPAQWYNLLLTNQSREAVRQKIMRYASPPNNPIRGLELRSSIPVKRDGGVFATFLVPPQYTKAQVNSMIQKNTANESTMPLLSFFTRAAAFPVKGSPWIEDLRRLPTTTVVVNFQGPALTQEEMYSLFRRYGTIIDIYPSPGPGQPSKVRYRSFRGAICAKNCVSGIEIHNTVLHVEYERIKRGHMVNNFFMNHTKIAIPVVIALLSIFAVLIFEPIREFSIEQKITHRYSLSWDNHWIKQVVNFTSSTMSQFKNYWGAEDSSPNHRHLWEERIEKVNDLKMWLEENNNTFVVIRGPRGSGKHELVMQHTLHDRENVLYLDCDKFVKSRTDAKFLRNVANQLGYFPIFPWLNSVTNVLDLMVQGLTGQKSGLSETKEAQFRNILTTSMMSIRRIALKGYKAAAKKAGDTNLKEEDYLQQHPEEKPVIVIDRFTGRAEMNGFIYKELSDWAAMLVQMNVAHVIFLTETVSPNHLLSESLPSQVFKTLILSDASKENSRNYVLSQLHDYLEAQNKEAEAKGGKILQQVYEQEKQQINEIDEVLEPLGGRMLDLQAFVRRVKSGEEPKEALEKMVEQSSEQITQIFLSDKYDPIKSARAWELIEVLSKQQSVAFEEMVFKNLFKAEPETCITELENSGLVTVSRNRGVPHEIAPAKPLFRAAFKSLVEDPELSAILRTRYLLKVVGFETNRIKKWEEELRPLGKSGETKLFKERLNYLSKKIEISSDIINNCEDEIKRLSQGKK
ncbi:YME2 (YMR302C) [Zygosaccharomyces parabailii]|nr:YME2 (YMR302C) [Zygosaccharomyces parabailii]CDH15126.1 probable Mitochondrial escape protein 2 [Zygosaccharomyces bailii ISA1307]